jgi:hypothetical protein
VSSLRLSPRGIARLVLVGGLGFALVFGLLWAFNPSEEGGVRFSGDRTRDVAEDDEGAEGEAEEDGAAEVDPEATAEPEPTPEPTETGPSPEELEELIAAAPEPSATSVQVLAAGGGQARARAAADALEELGYNVVNVTSARANVVTTTVWFNEGSEEAALGLRARDARVAEVEENQALSTGVNLHVLVGSDWED